MAEADLVEQRSPEWHAARAGRITGSVFCDVVERTKAGKPTAARASVARKLVFERLSDTPRHSIYSRSLEWGAEIEGFAQEAYEIRSGNIVQPCGFVVHPDYAYIGASPDGHCAPDGGIEMKCPMDEGVHVKTLLEGMPAEHMPQVQGAMLVTGWQWIDFISYDPRMAEPYRLYVQRVLRNDHYLGELLEQLVGFEIEVREMMDEVKRRVEQ